MNEQIITSLKIYSLKELLALRSAIRERMNYLEAVQESLDYVRQNTTEYLTLGQILVRLPEPSLLTPQVCTEQDLQQ